MAIWQVLGLRTNHEGHEDTKRRAFDCATRLISSKKTKNEADEPSCAVPQVGLRGFVFFVVNLPSSD